MKESSTDAKAVDPEPGAKTIDKNEEAIQNRNNIIVSDRWLDWHRVREWLRPSAWRARIVLWCAAVFTGLVVVGFSYLADYVFALFDQTRQRISWIPLLITPLGGMLIVFLLLKVSPMAGGSGIPQVISALQGDITHQKISRFVSLKISFFKVLLGAFALMCGFSVGREGPSVQIAAGIMMGIRPLLGAMPRLHTKDLLLAGGAAGVAAAFNTPLAGVVFAIEELSRRFEQRSSGLIITVIVISGLVAIAIQGNYSYFGHLDIGELRPEFLFWGLLLAVICGGLGGMFSRILLMHSANKMGWVSYIRQRSPVVFAGGCGLLVAILGIMSDGTAFGTGYQLEHRLLEEQSGISLWYAVVKFFATILSYMSGIPGGIFAPCLAIGASIGHGLSVVGQMLNEQAMLALGMVGFLAAVTQAPITSFIIVMEMLDNHSMVISLMATAFIASMISRLISPPLYHTLSQLQRQPVIALKKPPPARWWKKSRILIARWRASRARRGVEKSETLVTQNAHVVITPVDVLPKVDTQPQSNAKNMSAKGVDDSKI